MEIQRSIFGHVLIGVAWFINWINPSEIPIILSSIASILAGINYGQQVMDRRLKKRKEKQEINIKKEFNDDLHSY